MRTNIASLAGDICLYQVNALVNDNHISIHSISEIDFIALMTNNNSKEVRLQARNENYFRLSLKINGITFFSGEINLSRYEEILKDL